MTSSEDSAAADPSTGPIGASTDTSPGSDSAAEQRPTAGVIGLGNLGRAVGLRLLDCGWQLRVLDQAPQRQQHLEQAGAAPATPGELAEVGTLVFLVPDETAIWQVLSTDRLLERLGPEHTVVVISTILPTASRDLAQAVRERGARYVEAPVTGGAERARAGELTVFLGGESTDVDHVRPLLDAIGQDHHLLGPVGAGAATKLANQLIMFAALGGLQEGLRLAGAYGVDEQALLTAVQGGTADTWVGRNWGFFDRVATDYNDAGVPVDQRPWVKDLREVREAAAAIDQPVPITDALARSIGDEVERHAAQSEDRAVQSKDRAAQSEDRAVQSEDRAAESGDRAQGADRDATGARS